MNVARYRCNAPVLKAWPNTGKLVGVVALSAAQIHRAELGARQFDALSLRPVGHLRCQLDILTRALVSPDLPHERLASVSDLSWHLTQGELAALFALWHQVQADSVPNVEDLRREVLRRMADDDDQLLVDGMLASMSGLAEFYSCPMDAITEGQIAYFLTVQGCYRRLYAPQPGPQRALNKELLA